MSRETGEATGLTSSLAITLQLRLAILGTRARPGSVEIAFLVVVVSLVSRRYLVAGEMGGGDRPRSWCPLVVEGRGATGAWGS